MRVTAISAVHQQVHDRTGGDQEIRQQGEHVGAMIPPQEHCSDREQDTDGYPCQADG